MPASDLSIAAPDYGIRAWFADKVLVTAMTVSIGVHITVLAVRFVDPELFRVRSTDPPVEIILVNAKSDQAPGTVEALAQNNLDGGGANDSGRRTSPLPDSFEMRDGDSLESAKKAVQQLEEEQRTLLATLRESLLRSTPLKDATNEQAQTGQSEEEASEQLKRAQAEIAKQISDYQKRPRKHHFMPSASEYRYARYVEDWRARVEKIGNENYPNDARGRYYGALRMTVAIRKDGSVADTLIEQSSGSQVLDRAARRIVQMAGPYPPFPPEIGRDTDILEITRTWIFSNDQLATRSAKP